MSLWSAGAAKKEIGKFRTETGRRTIYGALLFLEKEGFDALLKQVQIAERYDIAIMACRSQPPGRWSTTCAAVSKSRFWCCTILTSRVFILGTLKEATRRYTFANKIRVIDLGLRLPDIAGLQAEDVFDRGSEESRRANLFQNGATSREVEFLLQRRVELNAMTSRQLVAFIERKLEQHGIRKVVPNTDELAAAYRLFHAISKPASRII